MNTETFFKLSYGLYVVSSAAGGRRSGYISNTVFQVTAEPPQFAVVCSKNNYTSELISASGRIGISVLKQQTSAEVISTFGYSSGREKDKFEKFNFMKRSGDLPILTDDTIAWFECEVAQVMDAGTHIIYITKVIDGAITDDTSEPLTYAWYRDVKKGKAPKNAPTYIKTEPAATDEKKEHYDTYKCPVCGYIYDPALGDTASNTRPGTSFESLPDTWTCPVCGIEKVEFLKNS